MAFCKANTTILIAWFALSAILSSQCRSSSAQPVQLGQGEAPINAIEKELSELITQVARQHLPHTFEDDRHWGLKAERWNGIRIRREGFRLETKRKRKQVNHGTWKKYTAKLVQPEKQFELRISNLTNEKRKLKFELDVIAKVELQGRQSKWVNGVQLYSLSADATSDIKMKVHVEIGIQLDLVKQPMVLELAPRILSADIEVENFKVHRVSKAGGELAQQVTKGVRKKLDSKIDEKEAKIVEKINGSIDKRKEKLRFSLTNASIGKPGENGVTNSRERESSVIANIEKLIQKLETGPKNK